ncbi:MAG: VPLPA-CTERM sorting domain-containing protein [Pseudomonadota bacterium]
MMSVVYTENETQSLLPRFGRLTQSLTVAAALAAGLGGTHGASAATLDLDVFLIAAQTAPTNGTAPPFTVASSTVYQLGLDASHVATTATAVDPFNFDVTGALDYASSAGSLNPLEAGLIPVADRVNSEAGTWNDVGVTNDGTPDADKNVDFGTGASVTFSGLTDGFIELIIAEDAALDPFNLSLCGASGCETVFDGFSSSLVAALGIKPEFSLTDSDNANEMDQAFLFRFSHSIFDDVKITESGNFGDARLEVDFVGIGVSPSPSVVPVPAGLPLILTGLGAFAWMRRRHAG